ncbi:MAG TPA: glycosyltransferase [Acidobacteriaceae bacterium]|nr:glycosyltransferase [Acidobacteriaceae bacterium]
MLLSFVVPAYNEEAYIGPCLNSILEQTSGLEHLTEIIVVNSASTDRTRESVPRHRCICTNPGAPMGNPEKHSANKRSNSRPVLNLLMRVQNLEYRELASPDELKIL